MKSQSTLLAFNRGLMSKQALARIDLKRTALSAEIQTNFIPRTLGSMTLRPGLGYLGSTKDDATSVFVPFIFSTTDTALVELTEYAMRVWVSDALVSRPAVTTTITNGSFATDIAGWTDVDEAGGVSAWVAGGYLGLTGTEDKFAGVEQQVTVAGANVSVPHALKIHVARGTATLSIGSSTGGTQYLAATTLRPGWHSITFTPAANAFVRLTATSKAQTLVSSCDLDATGVMTITTPWAAANLPNLRWDQSGDVLFVCDGAHQQQRIERQASGSWSVVQYLTTDGPFRNENSTPTTMTAAALSGATTLTASKATFYSTHVGALFRLASNGQKVAATITGEDQWTDPIRVTGVDDGRKFLITIGATSGATVTLQRSVGALGDWAIADTYPAATTFVGDDTLDNQIVYYRIGVAAGGYGSAPVSVELNYAAGSIDGIGRVTGFTSATVVSIDVVKAFGGTTATTYWSEGQWSDRRGWPSSVALYDGRLWWSGSDKINGSVSDAFSTFDDTTEGDAGPIKRNIGSGPVDKINWILPLSQLVIGTQGSELTARASSLDEPLTPSAFSLRDVSTQGSANVPALKVDTSGVFVQRNGSRIYELSLNDTGYSYASNDLTSVIPEIGSPGVIRMAVQRQPDTRIHCVRSDGTVALLVYDKAEGINCWVEVETDGVVEEVVSLPGTLEDAVYYVVKRTIGGSTKRYLEKWSSEAACSCTIENRLADSHIHVAGPITTVTGLDHLEGETVVAWGSSKDLGTFTVASGAITLPAASTGVTVGLGYTAQFKSARLILSNTREEVGFNQPKKIDHLGLLLLNTHAQGLQYGQDFTNLDDMPLSEGYDDIDVDAVNASYDEQTVELNGTWTTDARLCLQAAAPRPCTILACTISLSGHAKG